MAKGAVKSWERPNFCATPNHTRSNVVCSIRSAKADKWSLTFSTGRGLSTPMPKSAKSVMNVSVWWVTRKISIACSELSQSTMTSSRRIFKFALTSRQYASGWSINAFSVWELSKWSNKCGCRVRYCAPHWDTFNKAKTFESALGYSAKIAK